MATYRSLFLGCGARAQWHAPAYRELRNMELAGVCDLDAERREAFCQKYGVPAAYDDYETALSDLRPDIVHVITCPGRRVWEIETAARAGVRAVIVEKPLAIKPSEIEELSRIRAQYDMEIITNCQRRYYPQFRDGTIRDIVQNRIGDLYFVRASTRGNTMGMGPHMMDLLLFFLGEVEPEAVWAMAHTINEEGYQATHLAPESILAEYWFPNNVRVIFDCDPEALGTPGEDSFWMHLHFDFLGSKGRLYLTQNKGYWYQSEGMAEPVHGESSFSKQEPAGQRDFIQAVGDWLEHGTPHLNRFELHQRSVRALLAAQKSVYEGKRISLPTEFTDAEWSALRERLRGT